jgi:antitoxin VapB
VSLNVKDPEAHRLAQAIAEKTGDSLTKFMISQIRSRIFAHARWVRASACMVERRSTADLNTLANL